MQFEVNYNDQVSPKLERLVAALAPALVAKKSAPALREATARHISRLPRNKKGWGGSRSFWEDAARSTTWVVNADGTLSIRVNKLGFRQRYHGGVIRAVEAKFLTIPISSQAYGKTAADFPGAFIIRTLKGAYIVQYGGNVSKTGRRINKQNATLEFLFKLKPSVNQKGNPAIIPSLATLQSIALNEIGKYVAEINKGTA